MSDLDASLYNLDGFSSAERRRRLAAGLVGVASFPSGYAEIRMRALEAKAYHDLTPYPFWAFSDWITDQRGPWPTCMPLPQSIVRKGAKWLWGKPARIKAANNPDLEAYLREMWERNRMPSRMVAAAERAGVQGGVALKFSYDATADPPLQMQILSVVDELRLFYDPHDCDRLLLARVQYPFYNPLDGRYYLYREEWTDAEEIHYDPLPVVMQPQFVNTAVGNVQYATLPIVSAGGSSIEPDLYAGWEPRSRKPNPFGFIPLLPIRNIEGGREWGYGDLWPTGSNRLFRVIDRLNLRYSLADKSDQFDSERNLIFLDVDAPQSEIDRPLAPGQPLSLKSDADALSGDTDRQGQIVQLEASGKLRPYIREHAEDLKKMILDAVGSVVIDPESVTNKGNLTQAVLTQLYEPLIEATEEKRKTFGSDGVCKFLEMCALALSRMPGVPISVNERDRESYSVEIGWSDYFEMTPEEKLSSVSRFQVEISAGLLPRDRAVAETAKLEGMEDVETLLEELEEERAENERNGLDPNGNPLPANGDGGSGGGGTGGGDD